MSFANPVTGEDAYLTGVFNKVYRLTDGTYVPLTSRFSALHAYPIVNDKFDRYVILDNNSPANPEPLELSSAARLAYRALPQVPPGEYSLFGASRFLLGVPAPTKPFGGGSGISISVTAPTSSDLEKSVVYTYT